MTKLEPVPTLAQIEYFYLMGQDENIKVLHDRKLQNPCMGEHSLITSWFPVPPTVVLSVPPCPYLSTSTLYLKFFSGFSFLTVLVTLMMRVIVTATAAAKGSCRLLHTYVSGTVLSILQAWIHLVLESRYYNHSQWRNIPTA